jgi:NarL family two-component system response regulator LiaR
MTPVRVALSDDYEVVLRGLATMLAGHAEQVEVVEETTDPKMSHDVDVILYDTFGRLPDHDEKLRDVVEANAAKVVVYSWQSYPEDLARTSGAAGYIHKGVSAKELLDALVAVHEGRPVWMGDTSDGEGESAGDVPTTADDETMPSWPGQEHGLSARESEVLTFIARGLSNQEIAARSFLSVNTIKTYIRGAYRKIGVERRSQAVLWALRHGFDPEQQQERQDHDSQ